LFANVGTSTYDITDVSVHAIPGNHAYQITTTKRPLLSAKVNLVLSSDYFNNASWLKPSVTMVTGQTAPDASTTAFLMYPTASGASREIYQSLGVTTGTQVTVSVYAKAAGMQWLAVGGNGLVASTVFYDLVNGVVGTQAAGFVGTMTSLGNGWYRCATTFATNPGYPYVDICCADADGSITGTKTGTNGYYLWHPQGEYGTVATTYQWTGTAGVYNTSGFKRYLKFDGVDDFMVTNNITFSSNKMTAIAGLTNFNTTSALVVELSPVVTTNIGSFALCVGPITSSSALGLLLNLGTAFIGKQTAYTVPYTKVLTALFDGDQVTMATEEIMRVNGSVPVVSNSSGADAGASNFGSYPLYLGMRGGTAFPFSGKLYSLVIRGATSHLDQITGLETYVNNLTGAY
jgi:hypothetical protein